MQKFSQEKKQVIRRVKNEVDNIFPQLIQFRRKLHRNPETAWKEFETTGNIIEFLQAYRYTKIIRPLQTGLVTDFIVDPEKPLIALRADIDALPLQDEKEVDYSSQNPGVCHACGHDVHTTVMCGVAAVLSKLNISPPVNVRFIFQPAEEPIPSGAPKLLEKGVLKNVKSVWGMHVEPELPLGTISLTGGWVNAQSIRIEWEIKGSGGHSARPHLTANALLTGTQLVQKVLQTINSRWNRPDSPVILSFTKFHSGETYNAIPKSTFLTATLRLTDSQFPDKIISDIESLNREIETSNGVHIIMKNIAGAPPVVNDSNIVNKFVENVENSDDLNVKIEPDFRSMGGDDFGWYANQIPSALLRFGISGKKNSPQLHTGLFDVNEDVVNIAVKFFIYQILLRSP